MIVETGQLELAASKRHPRTSSTTRAATENGSRWLRTAFSHRRHWQRHDDPWIF
jgi:hypothetical protein